MKKIYFLFFLMLIAISIVVGQDQQKRICNITLTTSVTNSSCDTCHDGQAGVTPYGGVYPYSYTWYTPPIQSSQFINGLDSGTYSVCVSDAAGCTACDLNVHVYSCNYLSINPYGLTPANCSTCSDGTAAAIVSGGTLPYTYTWYTSPGQTTLTATGLTGGNYYYACVTDVHGCTACDTVNVTVSICSAYYSLYPDTAAHTYDILHVPSGIPPFTYNWDWGDGSPHDTTQFPSHTYSGSGNFTICLGITDSSGCTSSYCHSFYLLTPMSTVWINVVASVTGINELQNAESLSIYPNPTTYSLVLTTPSTNPLSSITIYSTDGRKLREEKFSSKSEKVELNLSGLARAFIFWIAWERRVGRW